jgi:hypothetical protein
MNVQTKAVLGSALLFPSLAFAQAAPDVSDVVTGIGNAAAPIAAIGGAVLLVLVGIKVFKWVRRAM